MPRIKIVKPFKFAEITEVHPRLYDVGEMDVSEECAKVALSEGWAAPLAEKREAGRPSQGSGPEKPSASSQAAKAPRPKTRAKSKAKPK